MSSQAVCKLLFANPLSTRVVRSCNEYFLRPVIGRFDAIVARAGSVTLVMANVLERACAIERSVEDMVFAV